MWQINRFMLRATWRAANVCLPIQRIYSPSLNLSHTEKLYFKTKISVDRNPVMSLQKTAGAHPLICSDSCSEESESMIHSTDKETSQWTCGKKKIKWGESNTFLERCALILNSKASREKIRNVFKVFLPHLRKLRHALSLPVSAVLLLLCCTSKININKSLQLDTLI